MFFDTEDHDALVSDCRYATLSLPHTKKNDYLRYSTRSIPLPPISKRRTLSCPISQYVGSLIPMSLIGSWEPPLAVAELTEDLNIEIGCIRERRVLYE